jgi:hypothetical protein
MTIEELIEENSKLKDTLAQERSAHKTELEAEKAKPFSRSVVSRLSQEREILHAAVTLCRGKCHEHVVNHNA